MNNKLLCLDIDTSCLINYKKFDQNKTQSVIVTKIFNGNGRYLFISNNPYQNGK